MGINQVFRKGILFFSLSLFVFAGCQKGPSNAIDSGDDNGGYAGDASKIEWISNDAISLADAAGRYYNGVYMRTTDTQNAFGSCATVATDTIFGAYHTLIIRFGPTNCVCLDGKSRRGTILVQYYGNYADSGSIHTIKFQDYYINNQQFTGTIKATKIDTTIVGDWYYKLVVNDSLITAPNEIITWSGALVRKWLSGYKTGTRSDDVFAISGAATLTRANTHVFTFAIQTPLQIALNCNYCEAGLVNITGFTGTRQLDYGVGLDAAQYGVCDNAARLNIDGHLYSIRF